MAIQFCTEARLASSAILHACQVIDDHARGLKPNVHAINNIRQELTKLMTICELANMHLRAIASGEMTSEAAKGLK